MILTKPTPWGEIHGKLSLTPEQAKKMFGFNMAKDAKGIILQKRNGKTIIRNLMKYTIYAVPKKLRARQIVFRILGKLAGKHLKDLIYPVWQESAKIRNCCALHLFMSVNLIRICNYKRNDSRRRWKQLLLSQGILDPPKIHARFYADSKKIMIAIKNTHSYQIGIAVLEMTTFNLYHWLVSADPESTVTLPIVKKIGVWNYIYLQIPEIKSPIVFAYFKEGNTYSVSKSLIPGSVIELKWDNKKRWLPPGRYNG
ncbi:MAG: hypothetical protein QMD71_01390 [bacterium]|nr:hypothetical protein [bacterium]